MHAIEKILANASSKKLVSAGDIVQAKVDVDLVHDRGWDLTYRAFQELGVKRVHDPNGIVFVMDHTNVPIDNSDSSLKLKSMREFAKKYGIKNIYDVGMGICHALLPEKGHAWPGAIIVGTDSHTTTSSAVGCLSCGVGKSEAGTIMAIGDMWFKVPETVQFNVVGKLQEMVMARDVAQYILGTWGTHVAQYMVAEFTGTTIRDMSMDDRFCLCNLSVEMGAKTGFIEPDNTTQYFFKSHTGINYKPIKTDSDYEYKNIFDIDASKLEPQVACPHNPDNVKNVTEVEGVEINTAGIGTCANGRLEDLKTAAIILKNKKVHPNVQALIVPATREIYATALSEGLIEIFIKAGATVGVPSCSGCGTHYRPSGYTSIHTGPRNFRGRGGHKDSFTYLGSPATVAASMVEGKIADPRKYGR